MRLRIALLSVAVVGTVAAAAGIGVRASYGAQVTGDEPQYLLTAISLGEDGDLDVGDEIAEKRYLPFHEIRIDPQSRPLDDRGTMVSPHDPLLPALLAVPVWLGGWVAAKWTLAVTAGALAALILWIAVRRFAVSLGTATIATGVFAASAPFAVYGNQVYPEVPAALCVAAGIAALTGPLRRTGSIILAAAVIALPWLSIKYAPVAAALAGVALVQLWRAGHRRAAGALVGTFAAAGLLFAGAHLAWYGGLTPYGVGDHFVGGELTVVGRAPNLPGRSVRLIGLLVDREFGLAAWQPAWLLGIPALAALARLRPAGWGALGAPLAAGWLTATFVALTMHGWWWPGRQTVVVLPAAVVAIAWWADRSVLRRSLLGALGIAGVVTLIWFLADGAARRVTWAVDFFETTAPTYRVWSALLPAYRAPEGTTWWLHALWIALAAAAALWGWSSARPGRDERHGRRVEGVSSR